LRKTVNFFLCSGHHFPANSQAVFLYFPRKIDEFLAKYLTSVEHEKKRDRLIDLPLISADSTEAFSLSLDSIVLATRPHRAQLAGTLSQRCSRKQNRKKRRNKNKLAEANQGINEKIIRHSDLDQCQS